ncbi:MAG: DUF559 domain-containing protein [Hyphomicrobiaceae bacterium]|nr:DUF559 domain-containing protein [Hyphomicrobiaceae bacterium]
MRERLTQLARGLRQRETSSEEKLWLALRNRQIDGWRFKRQAPCGRYVLDFYWAEAQLVIEVDGSQHMEPQHESRDSERTRHLESSGLRVLRFTNSDVLDNLEGVLDEIYLALGQRSAPPAGSYRGRNAFIEKDVRK